MSAPAAAWPHLLATPALGGFAPTVTPRRIAPTVTPRTGGAVAGAKKGITVNEKAGRDMGISLTNYASKVPYAWRAGVASAARYELRLKPTFVVLERCRYQGNRLLIRQRIDLVVEVYDLASKRRLASTTLKGSTPERCKNTESYLVKGNLTKYKVGAMPAVTSFEKWVKQTMAKYGFK
jgi:hypothetical protein